MILVMSRDTHPGVQCPHCHSHLALVPVPGNTAAAAVPALYGLAAGATAAVVAAPWIQPFLYGTRARDAATIAASVSAILAISLLAALASARAAARSNPAVALQAD